MGDFNGSNYKDEFVGQLVNFVASDKFQSMFENFFLSHALDFTMEEEHKLKYYEHYQTFHDLFDAQLESFCKSIDITNAEFMRKCREATTEDPKAKHYINILMSSVEYETFVKLMRIMRPVAQQRLIMKAELKDIPDSKDVGDSKSVAVGTKASAKADDFDPDNRSDAKVSKNMGEEKISVNHDDKSGSK
eukprot:gene10838-14549_t